MRSTRQMTGFGVGLALGAGLLVLGGCQSEGPGTSIDDFRSNPTPELSNASWTSDEIDNRLTITIDTNLRYLSEDLGRVLLLDKPSTLNKRGLYLY